MTSLNTDTAAKLPQQLLGYEYVNAHMLDGVFDQCREELVCLPHLHQGVQIKGEEFLELLLGFGLDYQLIIGESKHQHSLA